MRYHRAVREVMSIRLVEYEDIHDRDFSEELFKRILDAVVSDDELHETIDRVISETVAAFDRSQPKEE
jgi:deoxyhypusine synthase